VIGTPEGRGEQTRTRLTPTRDQRQRETALLWDRFVAATTEAERAQLREDVVVLNLSVARAVAGRYAGRGIPVEDLEQVASVGLVKAAQRFDPARQRDFLSYAVPTVRGEVKRHFRDLGWAVRPPRRIQDLQARVQAVSSAVQSQGRPVQPDEIAAHLAVDVGLVVESMTCSGAFAPSSLDAPLGATEASQSLGALLTAAGNDYQRVENAMVLEQALAALSARDRWILHRRFADELTQRQIGEELGVSQMQVSRWLARILSTLRTSMSAEPELGRSA
jgi:RNA polymerase sigma-B factor